MDNLSMSPGTYLNKQLKLIRQYRSGRLILGPKIREVSEKLRKCQDPKAPLVIVDSLKHNLRSLERFKKILDQNRDMPATKLQKLLG